MIFSDHTPLTALSCLKSVPREDAQHKTSSTKHLRDNWGTEKSHLKLKKEIFLPPWPLISTTRMFILISFHPEIPPGKLLAALNPGSTGQQRSSVQVFSVYTWQKWHTGCTSFSADLEENYFAQAEDLIQHTQLFPKSGCQVRSAVIKSQAAAQPAEIQFYPVSTEWT